MPPKIDYSLCDSCGICIFECSEYVYEYDSRKDVIAAKRPLDCIECFICVVKCPERAIRVSIPKKKRDQTIIAEADLS